MWAIPPPAESTWPAIVATLAILAIFVVGVWLPHQRASRRHTAFLSTLKSGDCILLRAGLIGEIRGFEDERRVAIVALSAEQEVRVLLEAIEGSYPVANE